MSYLIAAPFVAAVMYGVMICIHFGWTFVFGYFWPSGPDLIVRPDFWPFAAAWVLTVLVLRAIGSAFRS